MSTWKSNKSINTTVHQRYDILLQIHPAVSYCRALRPRDGRSMESPSLFFFLLLVFAVVVQVNGELSVDSPRMITRWQHKQENSTRSLCEEVILPMGYPCIEHKGTSFPLNCFITFSWKRHRHSPFTNYPSTNISNHNGTEICQLKVGLEGHFYILSCQWIFLLDLHSNFIVFTCAFKNQEYGAFVIHFMVETEDGYILAIQQIPHGKGALKAERSWPVFLQHGLFMGGDSWVLNPTDESLGYILADCGYDVWIGNVRGTQWSYGHVTLSENQKAFWEWSWQDLAEYDLVSMLKYVYTTTKSKVFFVGHSQGTIMGLAAFTKPDVVEMIEAAALLCPVSYLDHIDSRLILKAVNMHLDQILLALGIDELNFRSDFGVVVVEYLCDHGLDCIDMLSSITGENCCFNSSRIDYYLQYEPHPSSTKNLNHLFQMVRKGTFSKYDYGFLGNLKAYGSLRPPDFDLASIPASFPLWMAYGGTDALADVTDVKRTIKELQSNPELLYLDSYGHIDFLMGTNAKTDVYDDMIRFFQSQGSCMVASKRAPRMIKLQVPDE